MEEWQFYQPTTGRWIDIINCPLKVFKRKYRGKTYRLKPVYPITEIASEVNMINRFLITV